VCAAASTLRDYCYAAILWQMCVRILSGAYMIECSSYMHYVARMNVFVICDYVRLRCAYMLCFGFDASLIWIFFLDILRPNILPLPLVLCGTARDRVVVSGVARILQNEGLELQTFWDN